MRISFAAITIVALIRCAAGQSFTDNFDGPSINPFWTVSPINGTISLSNLQSHSSPQSVRFYSPTGAGNRYVRLTHQFAAPMKGQAQVWFYDTSPGSETLYEYLELTNSAAPEWITVVGTQDFDAYCYTAYVYNYNTTARYGPNANCGIYLTRPRN